MGAAPCTEEARVERPQAEEEELAALEAELNTGLEQPATVIRGANIAPDGAAPASTTQEEGMSEAQARGKNHRGL